MVAKLVAFVCFAIASQAAALGQVAAPKSMSAEMQAINISARKSELGDALFSMFNSCVDRFELDLSDQIRGSPEQREEALRHLLHYSAHRHQGALEEAVLRAADEREVRQIGGFLDDIRGGGLTPEANRINNWTLAGSKEELVQFRTDLNILSFEERRRKGLINSVNHLLKDVHEKEYYGLFMATLEASRREGEVEIELLPALDQLVVDDLEAAWHMLLCARLIEPVTGPILSREVGEIDRFLIAHRPDLMTMAQEVQAEVRRVIESLQRSSMSDIRAERTRTYFAMAGIDLERIEVELGYRNGLINTLSERDLFFLVRHLWNHKGLFYPWLDDINGLPRDAVDAARIVFRSLLLRHLAASPE